MKWYNCSVLYICEVLLHIAHLFFATTLWSRNFDSFYKGKYKSLLLENGQHPFWILLQLRGSLFGVCIKKYCHFTEIGPISNWPMCLPKYQESIVQGPNRNWKSTKEKTKSPTEIHGHIFSEWLVVIITVWKASLQSSSHFILIYHWRYVEWFLSQTLKEHYINNIMCLII